LFANLPGVIPRPANLAVALNYWAEELAIDEGECFAELSPLVTGL